MGGKRWRVLHQGDCGRCRGVLREDLHYLLIWGEQQMEGTVDSCIVQCRDWEAAAALIGANGHLNNHSSAFYNTATAQTFLPTTTWTLLSNRNMQGHCNTKYYCNNGYHWKDQPSSHQHSRDKPGLTNYTEGKNRNEIGKLHDIVNDGGINQNISPGRPLIHLGCGARCSHLIEMH